MSVGDDLDVEPKKACATVGLAVVLGGRATAGVLARVVAARCGGLVDVAEEVAGAATGRWDCADLGLKPPGVFRR